MPTSSGYAGRDWSRWFGVFIRICISGRGKRWTIATAFLASGRPLLVHPWINTTNRSNGGIFLIYFSSLALNRKNAIRFFLHMIKLYISIFRVEKKFLHQRYQHRRVMVWKRHSTRTIHWSGEKRGENRPHPLENGPAPVTLLTLAKTEGMITTEQCLTKTKMMTLQIRLMMQVSNLQIFYFDKLILYLKREKYKIWALWQIL